MPLFYLRVRDLDHRSVKTLPTYFYRVVYDFEAVPDECSKNVVSVPCRLFARYYRCIVGFGQCSNQ